MLADLQHDIDFKDSHFERFCELVAEYTGIKLSDTKVEMVYRRFAPRIRELGLDDLGQSCELLQGRNAEELLIFSNIITTNLTSFFRENHHFEYLRKEIIPVLKKQNAASKKIRIWSAGCSTGEEPYSIAMVLREAIPHLGQWDARILATDLDTTCLEKAKLGKYSEKNVEGIANSQLRRWFTKRSEDDEVVVKVKPELQSLIAFRHLNLMHRWPFSGLFDVIFCRNVMIYFDKPTQGTLIKKFSQHQKSEDTLIIGHSENITAVTNDYSLSGQTIYKRN